MTCSIYFATTLLDVITDSLKICTDIDKWPNLCVSPFILCYMVSLHSWQSICCLQVTVCATMYEWANHEILWKNSPIHFFFYWNNSCFILSKCPFLPFCLGWTEDEKVSYCGKCLSFQVVFFLIKPVWTKSKSLFLHKQCLSPMISTDIYK